MSTPSIVTDPDEGESSPAMRPRSVDLPLPDGPTIARNSPRGTSSVSEWRIVSGSLPLITVFETSRRLITCGFGLHNGPEHAPDVVGQNPGTLCGRMNAVALVEP